MTPFTTPAIRPTLARPVATCVLWNVARDPAWAVTFGLNDARHLGLSHASWSFTTYDTDGTTVLAVTAQTRDPAARYCDGQVAGAIAVDWMVCDESGVLCKSKGGAR